MLLEIFFHWIYIEWKMKNWKSYKRSFSIVWVQKKSKITKIYFFIEFLLYGKWDIYPMIPLISHEPHDQTRTSRPEVFFKISQNSQENVVACVLTRKLENQTKVQGNTKERHVTKIRSRRAEEVKVTYFKFSETCRHLSLWYLVVGL